MLRRVKNAIVLLPGALFVVSGMDSLHEAYGALGQGIDGEDVGGDIPSYCYELALCFEAFIIFKNLVDVTSGDKDVKSLTFTEKFKLIKTVFKMKKDPVLSAILHENIITVSSTLIPIIFKQLYKIYPLAYFDPMATSIIACIQLYLSVNRKLLRIFVGKG